MRKLTMKTLSYLLAVALLSTTVVACGKSDEEKQKEATKETLKVDKFRRSSGKAY